MEGHQRPVGLSEQQQDSLQLVLRAGLAFPTQHRRRVQERVLPDGICTIAV